MAANPEDRDLNYVRTLIAVADDCPVRASTIPSARGGKKTVAVIQYELLAGNPHALTQPDVLFESWLRRQDPPPDDERARLWERFFAKPQACLRASPLPKKHGFGLLFDEHGRVALCPMESAEYQRLLTGPEVTVRKAMRSTRA